VAWLVVLGVFGAFAPKVMSSLSGAGWQDSGSTSVKARDIIAKDFAGLGSTALQVVVVDKSSSIASDPAAQAVISKVTALLKADKRVSVVVAPQPGMSLSKDGRTGIIQAGAKADANDMVRAADELVKPITQLSNANVSVQLTGSSALWANFNKVNHAAMIKSEVLSWPVTMIVLVIAFGSLVAAGLPLMLTLVGLLTAAGALVLATHIAPVSIWALNFAMMFAPRPGYRLRAVHRRPFPGSPAHAGRRPRSREGIGRCHRRNHGYRRQGCGVQRGDGAGCSDNRADCSEPRIPQHGTGNHALGDRRPGRHPDAAARRPGQARKADRRRPDSPARSRSPRAGAR
jgi:hypothetical protein